jgi:hypothetical protein
VSVLTRKGTRLPLAQSLGGPAATPATKEPAPVATLPFVRSSFRHTEQFWDRTQIITTAPVALGPVDVAPFGYARSILLIVETSTDGTAGSGVLTATGDGPFNVIRDISLSDVNGQNLVGPLNGYDLFLMNLFGGYAWNSDPRTLPDYEYSLTRISFTLRIPLEITQWDAYGSIPNMNAASTYKLNLSLAGGSTVYSTAPTAYPTLRIRAVLEAWALPQAQDLNGAPQEQRPPAVNTTQFWTKNNQVIAAGDQSLRIQRMGNLIRNIIFVNRDASGVRKVNTDFPDPIRITWDNRDLMIHPFRYHQTWLGEMYQGNMFPDRSQTPLDDDASTNGEPRYLTGVVPLPFHDDQDGHPGNENRNLWLPTVESQGLYLRGTFVAAGSVDILVNDVIPAGAK